MAMEWIVIVIVIGIAVLGSLGLGLVALGLVGRVRRNRAELDALKADIEQGRARLRAGQEQTKAWFEHRRASRASGGGA